MSQPTSEYQHSGSIGTSLLLVPLAGIAASLVCGLAYAYATLHNPLAWLAVILVFVHGFAVGLAVAMATKMSKCRNTTVAGILGILVGLFAVYSAWATFLFVFLRANMPLPWSEFPVFFVAPLSHWEIIVAINKNGWFEIFGNTPTGIVLWALWACEALIIVTMSGLMGTGSIADEVFCERCRSWADDGVTLCLAAPEEMEDLQRLSEGQLNGLNSLEPLAADEYPRIQVETKNCAGCDNMSTCKIKAVMAKEDKEGNLTESSSDLTRHLLISPEEYKGLVVLARRPIPNDEEEVDIEDEDEGAANEQ